VASKSCKKDDIMNGQAPAVKTVGGFEVLSKIGQGAMGTVFKARQPALDRIVALKVLPPRIASQDPAFIDRFIREARVSAKLNHPNIVQGIEVGMDGPTRLYYFAMEYIDGPSVRDVLNRLKRIEERRALEIALGVANALVCAHKAGIVHRDIKPDNILISSAGEIKLTDLGLARSVTMGSGIRFHGEKDESQIIMGPSADAALTIVGAAIGTPSYMAPEAARAQDVDIRTDLYGVGATLFHMVTGQLPFKGVNAEDTMRLLVTTPVPDPRKINPSISQETSALILRLMQKEPFRRIQTPEELVAGLEQLLNSEEQQNTDQVRSSNSVIPRARRSVSKVPLRSVKGAKAGTSAIVACVIAFVVGAAGIGLLVRNARANADKPPSDNNPPVIPTAPEKSADGGKTADPEKHPVVSVPAKPADSPPEVVAKSTPSTPQVPQPAKSADERAMELWTPQVEARHFREALTSLQNFCAANHLNDTATARLRSAMEAAIEERMRRLIAHARDLIDSGRAADAVTELTSTTLLPGEEDPFYRAALDDAKTAAAQRSAPSPAKDLQSRWQAEVHKAMRDGARKLADGREFTLNCVDHDPYHLTKSGRVVYKGLSSDESFINIAVADDSHPGTKFETIGFHQLTPETQFQLGCQTVLGDRAAMAALAVKFSVILHICYGAGTADQIQKALDQAKAGGCPDAILADGRTLLAENSGKSAPEQKADKPPAPTSVDNVFARAHANDYVDYKNGPQIMRMKVTRKDDKSAGFRIFDFTADMKPVPNPNYNEATVPLNRHIGFFDMFCHDCKKLAESDEELTIDKKTYKCHVVSVCYPDKRTQKEVNAKLWFCNDVPLFGLVRWESPTGPLDFLKSGNE
jgi:serine/threonine-protein kinase